VNGRIKLDEIYSEYSLVPIDDLVRFWGSKVEVTLKVSTWTLVRLLLMFVNVEENAGVRYCKTL